MNSDSQLSACKSPLLPFFQLFFAFAAPPSFVPLALIFCFCRPDRKSETRAATEFIELINIQVAYETKELVFFLFFKIGLFVFPFLKGFGTVGGILSNRGCSRMSKTGLPE